MCRHNQECVSFSEQPKSTGLASARNLERENDDAMKETKTTAIWWIRRDLRLADNPTLHAALRHAGQVLPIFVLDPKLLDSPYASERRSAFLLGGLRELDTDLRKIGSRLIVREGAPERELSQVLQESGAHTIYAHSDYSPYARSRDSRLAQLLPLQFVQSITIHPPDAVRKNDRLPYTVFTPYSRKWKSLPQITREDILKAPAHINTPEEIGSLPIPEPPVPSEGFLFPPGETEAFRRLDSFLGGDSPRIYAYAKERNRADLDGTSHLSPYFRFGMLSARFAALGALEAIANASEVEAKQGAGVWLDELIWRDFYVTILANFPNVRHGNFRHKYDGIIWHNNENEFDAWREGRTGFPFIDAAMRQLTMTGWMHNRARMAVASFLVKDLLIDWRWGERWFMQQLIDGDPAANNGGWQWSAGTGTDAAPYFRIFNPVSQGKKFDPAGTYTRRWIPELADVPANFIQEPWRMTGAEQKRAHCIIGQDYPTPIVDHSWARQRTLEAYRSSKG